MSARHATSKETSALPIRSGQHHRSPTNAPNLSSLVSQLQTVQRTLQTTADNITRVDQLLAEARADNDKALKQLDKLLKSASTGDMLVAVGLNQMRRSAARKLRVSFAGSKKRMLYVSQQAWDLKSLSTVATSVLSASLSQRLNRRAVWCKARIRALKATHGDYPAPWHLCYHSRQTPRLAVIYSAQASEQEHDSVARCRWLITTGRGSKREASMRRSGVYGGCLETFETWRRDGQVQAVQRPKSGGFDDQNKGPDSAKSSAVFRANGA